MDGKGVFSKSPSLMFVEKGDSLHQMYLGISCAFLATKFMSIHKEHNRNNEEEEDWDRNRVKMLQTSAQLLGLLVWKAQKESEDKRKSEILVKENEELKKGRRENGRANEKVVRIFAAQEQSWFNERKRLRQQIGALLNELRVREKRNDESMDELNYKLRDMEDLVQSKDKLIEEEEEKRKGIEEKLKTAEKGAKELKEAAKTEALNRASELKKHKTAFIELVSNQRQLEADMGRAIRQFEATKHELDSAVEQKEEAISMVQKLSVEIVRMRKDSEQKDQILSAMLRKSKLDTSEKQMLLKELKLLKARQERHSLRSILSKHTSSRSRDELIERSKPQSSGLVEYTHDELKQDPGIFSRISEYWVSKGNNELGDTKRMENWVRTEAEKYASAIEQRHYQELEAFAEQMRLKDEKLESFRWKLLSVELESKRLQTHTERLNHDMSQLKQSNIELQALNEELIRLQSTPLAAPKSEFNSSGHERPSTNDAVWSKVKIIKKKEGEKEEENTAIVEHYHDLEIEKKEEIVEKVPEEETPEEEKKEVIGQSLNKKNSCSFKMDLNALGVSFKIKRLKQQLLMLERFTGKQENGEDRKNDDETNTFLSLMSLLNKQVGRYNSLQEKADHLCGRMEEHGINVAPGESSIPKTKKETETLANFLEETFQLQRYIVATGQKMMEIQAKVASGFTDHDDSNINSDIKRFADNIGSLFREVQRGLEVRISRLIGDLEGTLACDGIIHFRK